MRNVSSLSRLTRQLWCACPNRRPQIAPLALDKARAFLAVAETHRLGALFSVALACGLRLGEATGLRWDDVDSETGEMQIRQQLQCVAAP